MSRRRRRVPRATAEASETRKRRIAASNAESVPVEEPTAAATTEASINPEHANPQDAMSQGSTPVRPPSEPPDNRFSGTRARTIALASVALVVGVMSGSLGTIKTQDIMHERKTGIPDWASDPPGAIEVRWKREGAQLCSLVNGTAVATTAGRPHEAVDGKPVVDVTCAIPYGRKDGEGPTFRVEVPIGSDGQ